MMKKMATVEGAARKRQESYKVREVSTVVAAVARQGVIEAIPVNDLRLVQHKLRV